MSRFRRNKTWWSELHNTQVERLTYLTLKCFVKYLKNLEFDCCHASCHTMYKNVNNQRMYILLQMKFRREVASEKKNSFLIFYQYILSLPQIKPTNEKYCDIKTRWYKFSKIGLNQVPWHEKVDWKPNLESWTDSWCHITLLRWLVMEII